MTTDDLLMRLEKATGPSGTLNDAIYETVYGYQKCGGSAVRGGMLTEIFWITGARCAVGGGVLVGSAPPFTFNIETARQLLLTGMSFTLSGPASDYMTPHAGRAVVQRQDNYISEYSPQFRVEASGATPAIALCLAALKSRAASATGAKED